MIVIDILGSVAEDRRCGVCFEEINGKHHGKNMKHIDLFSGIGGFALAAERVFGDVEHVFVENDAFCQAVLKKNFPNSKIYGDIRQFITDSERKRPHNKKDEQELERERCGELCIKQSRNLGNSELPPAEPALINGERVFLLTGGFPCQPFSHAGRRKGTADDRYLWPEMFRVIQLYKPEWVIAENVRGLVTWNEGMVLETVCADLESEGYEVQPFIIPACAVGAPHRRDRVWIVANSTSGRERSGEQKGSRSGEPQAEIRGGDRNADWEADWREVALATCDDSMDDGLPREVDGVPYSFAKWRRESLKSYGNAIVPQVAEIIMKSIEESR